MPEGAVYVGRPGKWGNPYAIDRLSAHEYVGLDPDGTESIDGWGGRNFAAEWAVRMYRADLVASVLGAEVYDRIRHELAGKDLACWCPLDQPCHADVLLEIANAR